MSRGVKIKINKRYLRELESELDRRLLKVGDMVASEIRRKLGEGSTRADGPSAPGEYPHADTGTLRKSITVKVDRENHVVSVGTPLEYGLYLEEGIGMEPRPYLQRTIDGMRSKIIHELTRPIK